MADAPLPAEERAPKPCPICGKPPVAATAPFCSKRCADIDLHKWLGGVYAVPARETDDEDGVESGLPEPDAEG